LNIYEVTVIVSGLRCARDFDMNTQHSGGCPSNLGVSLHNFMLPSFCHASCLALSQKRRIARNSKSREMRRSVGCLYFRWKYRQPTDLRISGDILFHIIPGSSLFVKEGGCFRVPISGSSLMDVNSHCPVWVGGLWLCLAWAAMVRNVIDWVSTDQCVWWFDPCRIHHQSSSWLAIISEGSPQTVVKYAHAFHQKNWSIYCMVAAMSFSQNYGRGYGINVNSFMSDAMLDHYKMM